MTEDARTRLIELIQEAEDAISVGFRRHRSVPEAVPAPEAQSQPAAVEERQKALYELEQEVLVCTRCPLNEGHTNAVPGMGVLDPLVMVIGEGPGAQEDEQGKPFVGRAGRLLDRMFAPVGLARDAPSPPEALYITNILPWRPPQNRDPRPEEIAMMTPFLERHVALAGPELLIAMGNISCQALLGRRGITRLRGTWAQALGLPCLPMFHPAYLLRNPAAKREAWADVLEVAARLAAG